MEEQVKAPALKEQLKMFLDERAKTDELFAKTYAKENKSLDECCEYIIQEVKKMRNNEQCIALRDDIVIGMAVHYFDEDSIKVEKPAPAPAPKPTPKIVERDLFSMMDDDESNENEEGDDTEE